MARERVEKWERAVEKMREEEDETVKKLMKAQDKGIGTVAKGKISRESFILILQMIQS